MASLSSYSGLATSNLDTRDLEDLQRYTDLQNKLQYNAMKNSETNAVPVYKIFNIKDLLAELDFEGRGKGSKTEAYLESVIKKVNESPKYQWVQFFQLVDVFFVVVEVVPISAKPRKATTAEEIHSHYNPPSATNPESAPVVKRTHVEKFQEPIQEQPVIVHEKNYAQKNLKKQKLPWAK